MLHCESEHRINSVSCHSFDLIKLSCRDEIFFNHPATTAAKYFIESKVIIQVVLIYTACRHEMHLGIRCCHSLDLGDSAILLGREKLYAVKSKLDSLLNFTGSCCARNDRYSDALDILNIGSVESGAYDKLSSGCLGSVRLLCIKHGSCTNDHLGEFLRNDLDCFLGRIGTECNLSCGKTALNKCLCKRCRVFGIINRNYGYDTNFVKFFANLIHFNAFLIT